MKKLKRITSILLMLVLMFGLRSPAHAAEGEGVKLAMTASQSSLKVNETMVLTIRTDRDFTTRGSGMTLYYDARKLKPDLDASSAMAPLRIDAVTVSGQAALRVSFLPGLESVAFSASEPLAQICFRALAATEQTDLSMGAAYLYDSELTEIALERPSAVNLTIEPAEVNIPVTGITLDRTELTMEEGEMEALAATIEPLGASDPTVLWSSSDEKVTIVSGGVIKAFKEGTAVITAATRDGGFTATCTVTVTAPDAGYTVKMPADTGTTLGDAVRIPVSVGNQDKKTGYNAFDISFAYDPEVLELTSTEIPGVTVSVKDGRINVLGYGEDRRGGSVPFALEFKALKMESTKVQIISARVDNSGNAVVKNTSLAALVDDTTAITVTGYPVSLPEGFKGEGTAVPGVDYTFAVPDDYYDYTVAVTVDGEPAAVTKNGDGSYTIPGKQVTGKIVVTAARTGKTFKVTLGTDMAGSASAQYGIDYVATISRNESYRYTVNITLGGKSYTGYTASGKTYTIPGTDITGDIVFKVTKQKISKPSSSGGSGSAVSRHSVTFTGTGAGAAQGNATSIVHGGTYTLTLKKQTGYGYQVSYKMGGKPAVSVAPNGSGSYVIPNVTAPLEIIVERNLSIQVSVWEYLTLDRKSVFLIQADADLDDGSVLTYNGNVMYNSQVYGGWVYLVITDQEPAADQVRSQVRVSAQTGKALGLSGVDVDGNGQANWNDAHLIRELYNAKYTDFHAVNMESFFRADVNGDRKVDIRDIAWVAWKNWESEGAGA